MTGVVVWISESTWETCVEKARALLPGDAEVTLVHVAPIDAEELAEGYGGGLLGRHSAAPLPATVRAIAAEEAEALLSSAQERFGRPVNLVSRRGHPERELLEACADADLLVLARDGEARLGPKSLGPRTRFILDHVPCEVLLVWAATPPRGRHRPPPSPP